MKTRALSLKLASLTVATASGPVFAMLDPPGVADAHGDTMDAGALALPPPGADGVSEVPLYYLHSYHADVVADTAPANRIAIGTARVWTEGGQAYFTPKFFGNTDLSDETKRRLEAREIECCSIGYLSLEATPNGAGEDVHKARLIEVSLVEQGAKEGAVRVKTMNQEQVAAMVAELVKVRAEVAALKTKSMGVEMMCYAPGLYFATEYLEHLAEGVAAAQTFLQSDNPEPTLAAIASASISSLGAELAKVAGWLASPAARGDAPVPTPASTPEPEAKSTEPEPEENPVMKWWTAVSTPAEK